jgi:hypothetical protein
VIAAWLNLQFVLPEQSTGSMLRWKIASVNLIVTLRAVAVERWTQRGIVVNVSPTPKMVVPVSHMAAQAQERRRLAQQVVGHRAVRFVADGAILRHWRMFIREGALFVRVAFVAN